MPRLNFGWALVMNLLSFLSFISHICTMPVANCCRRTNRRRCT